MANEPVRMKISANDLIRFLIEGYKEALEDDGGYVADELIRNWPTFVKEANYCHETDSVVFVPAEDYEDMPDMFKKLSSLV